MLKVLELFGGIGACTQALKNLDQDFTVVDYVEIDKYAVKSYNAINGTDFEPQDITEWDKDIECDLIMHGSPCQDFSLAGLQEGGDEGSGTRSSLMYETLRIVKKIKPKYVVWENVKNLLSKAHVHNFNNYLDAMESLGYTNYYKVLNSKDYNIPQNRERVFTISILGKDKEFNFPTGQKLDKAVKDMLEPQVEEKFYLTESAIKTYNRDFGSKGKQVNINDVVPTLTASMGTGGGNVPIFYAPTSGRLRKLTPKECWRLMGFSEDSYTKAAKVNSNSQLYKQAGNSIVVNVLQEIFKELLKYE